jgi:tetratricopeptide (TPR) repeat protein
MAIAFTPDGTRLASASRDFTIKLWDVATGSEVLALRGHTGTVTSLSFSRDGCRLASGSNDFTARLWDATPLPPERLDASARVAHGSDGAPRATATANPASGSKYERELAGRILELTWLLSTASDPLSSDTVRALTLAREAVELEPKRGSSWLSLGVLHALSGDRPAAEQAFRKAEELGPVPPGVLNNLAWFLARYPNAKFRDPGRAVELARKALEFAPKRGTYWNTLGVHTTGRVTGRRRSKP